MKIEIELPDWIETRALYIMSANEMVAVKLPGGKWHVVEEKCNRCGTCCKQFDTSPFMHLEDGSCPYLKKSVKGTECGLQMSRPLACCVDNPGGIPDYCNIKLRKID